uniref:ribulose-bisphosphate carboxylase large subunit family protein n=1 Tax=Stappia sp. TaxID=1870903 RepID=UPI003BABC4D5
MSRLEARYEVESPLPLERVAQVIAGEQSCGTFLRLPGETDDLRERAGARIEHIEEGEARSQPSLPCRISADLYHRGEITLSWPLDTMGPSLTNVLATVAGNLFELAEVSALRLLDVTFPEDFASAYAGPAFGVSGTRRLAGVEGRPLIGTIIKPSVGLSPEDTAALVADLVDAGIDFIKDDELQGNGPACPLEARVDAVMRVVNDRAQRTGKKAMVAFNITGEMDEMKRGADHVLKRGGTCVMASLHSIGLAGLSELRRHVELPLHCHRNGWGLFSRSPDIGMSYVAWQKFWRIAGADHLHVNGLANKFSESDESVIASARAVGAPLFGQDKPAFAALPVFSSGQTAAQMPATHAAVGSPDFLYCAGGGIMGHPRGTAAGVMSLRQAADAAMRGVSLDDHARHHSELAEALALFKDKR